MENLKITKKILSDLHEKGTQLDPHKFDYSKLSYSGRHVADVTDDVV